MVLEIVMHKFDFTAPAELFPSRNRKIANKVKYRRFEHASEAIRFAVEELPEPLLLGAYIEIDEERLGHKDIRALYDSASFPLNKKAVN
jgi:Arc/MetJ-type ribon-helix-helix transcriptional regulator